ncbi:response regulator [Granulicella sibirica]|uniref:response regulator n=1 Tax=Granulicella sibirica TaxID=2479048 RepID=UPI0010089EC8|nr:response regulator transcription factor [Granulicella sibirica]
MEIRVLIIDDHPIMRVGVAAMMAHCKDMKAVAFAGTGEEGLKYLAGQPVDIVLLDLRLPGISGLQTLLEIGRKHPDTRVIILTTYEGDEDVHRSLKAGARGYLIKGLPTETLVAAIRKVHGGGKYVPVPLSKSLAERTAETCLSPRECEVLEMLAQGKSNREIGLALGIRESTVKCHVSVILTRLDVNDRTQAVVVGLQRGFLHLYKPA